MYEAHWHLSSRPFENRFSPDFYYPSDSHQAALLKLRYAIENRRAVGLVCAHSGMGKSMLLQSLRSQLPDFVGQVVQIAYPALTSDQLVHYLANQLAPDYSAAASSPPAMASAIAAIESCLAKTARDGRHTIVIIDDAEWLEDLGTLPTLRLLLNLSIQESAGESAFTILLCGQPTLVAQLERCPALDQRVAVRCFLNKFNIDETIAYIGHRLRISGGKVESIFQHDALDAIHELCDGVPRRINSLCDLALMVGYAQEISLIKLDLIESVHRELVPS